MHGFPPDFSSEATGLNGARAERRTAILLEEYGAVYIEVPKVACSSIKVVLADVLGIGLGDGRGDPHQVEFPMPESQEIGPSLYPDLISFAFVRNPWDRLVSCYRDKILGEAPDFTSFHPERRVAYCLAGNQAFRAGMSFGEFVEAVAGIPDAEADEHFRSQHTFVTNDAGAIAVDRIGRFESLADDFSRIAADLALPIRSLPHLQAVSKPRPYTEFYDPDSRRLVADRYAEDILLFDYDFGAR